MASAAEQLAANINFATFSKATELQKRILFAIGALVVYRLGTFIPIPGVDPAAFAVAFESQSQGILGMFDVFSGGAVSRLAIFALNVMPYISASIIIQLMATSVPSLERLKKEGFIRLATPRPFLPFVNGANTPSGRIQFDPPPAVILDETTE